MRVGNMILVGSLAALVATTAPVLARNSQPQKTADEQTSSSSCYAYQQAPDGTWTALPCQEPGASARTAHKQQMTGNSVEQQR